MEKIRIEVSGYGAEVVIGEVTKEQMDFMLSNKKKNLGRYITLEENQEYDMDWYDLSDIYHETSASAENARLTVYVNDSVVVDENLDDLDYYYDDLVREVGDSPNPVKINFRNFDEEIMNDKIYLVSVSVEKGTFLELDTEDEAFDMKKLVFDVHGLEDYGFESLLNLAYYGEEEFEYNSDNDNKDFFQYFIVNGEVKPIK